MEDHECHNVTCLDPKHQAARRDYVETKEWSPEERNLRLLPIVLVFAALVGWGCFEAKSNSGIYPGSPTAPISGYDRSDVTQYCKDPESRLCKWDSSFMKKPDEALSKAAVKFSNVGNKFFKNYKK